MVGATAKAAGTGISNNAARLRCTNSRKIRNTTINASSSCGSAATTGTKHNAEMAAACTDG